MIEWEWALSLYLKRLDKLEDDVEDDVIVDREGKRVDFAF